MIQESENLLWATMPAFKSRVARAQKDISGILAAYSSPYVSCSFGKDSSVLLHLVLQSRPQIPVIFVRYAETEMLDNYADVMRDWGGINLIDVLVDCPVDSDLNEKNIIPQIAASHGFDLGFVGLRIEESKRRKFNLLKTGMLHNPKNGIARACPLMHWSQRDVSAYCVSRRLPLLLSYQAHGFDKRTTTGFASDEMGFRESQMRDLKAQDVSAFNKLTSGAKSVLRYT